MAAAVNKLNGGCAYVIGCVWLWLSAGGIGFEIESPPKPAASSLHVDDDDFAHYPPRSAHPPTIDMAEIRRKLVIVGDGACGKVVPRVAMLQHSVDLLSRPAC